MVLGSEGAVYSQSLTKKQQSTETLTSPLLPTLPFDLIPEILSRLPVKFLLQFRCVCKSWNSLISDHKFANKHLRISTTTLVHTLTNSSDLPCKSILKSYPLDSIYTDVTISHITQHITQLEFPSNDSVNFIGSCNGILCLADFKIGLIRLWNPSIRKFKESPPLEKPQTFSQTMMYGFGHDPNTDHYKVVVILRARDSSGNLFHKNVDKPDVKVHTLGTNFWRSIQELPYDSLRFQQAGKSVSGTINWVVSKYLCRKSPCFIVSLNLRTESYQEVLLPDFGVVDTYSLHLGVLRNCLCMVSGDDVWVMTEYANIESWTKLFTISYMRDPSTYCVFIKAIHTFEDGQVLLKFSGDVKKLIIYNSRNGTSKPIEFENTSEVCVESLISPCL